MDERFDGLEGLGSLSDDLGDQGIYDSMEPEEDISDDGYTSQRMVQQRTDYAAAASADYRDQAL